MEKISPSLIFIVQSPFLLLLLFSCTPTTSARFFPNISSIPNNVKNSWDSYSKFLDCHLGQKVDGLAKLKQYFQRFGYINDDILNFTDDFDDSLESALKTYQQNFNLKVTGQLNAPTLQQILQPRCANPDIVNGTTFMNSGKAVANTTNPSHIHAVSHFKLLPGKPRWPKKKTKLTYAFLPKNKVNNGFKRAFARAFRRWSEVTGLRFIETASFNRADIKISYQSNKLDNMH